MQAILFDLDGTLLDIDIEAFIQRYFAALEVAVASIVPESEPHEDVMRAIYDATQAVMQPHRGVTNREVFYREFKERTGLDLEVHWEVFDRFYAEVFPTLQGDIGPSKGAREALQAARECDLRVAVATNPIFPLSAIEHRMSWAGIQPNEVDVITSFETMTAAKPLPDYFRQTAEQLGVAPAQCLMVGDDRSLDLPAADVGMRTFYVGSDPDAPSDYSGDLLTLASELPRLCER